MSSQERTIRAALGLFAAVHLAVALLGLSDPGFFHDTMATFDARNDLLVREISVVYLVTGVGMLVALGRKSWRVPVLIVALVHYCGHGLSHALDAGQADPAWVGSAMPGLIFAGAVVLGAVTYASR